MEVAILQYAKFVVIVIILLLYAHIVRGRYIEESPMIQMILFDFCFSGSLMTRNLNDIVKKDNFVLGSEYLSTLLVVVAK